MKLLPCPFCGNVKIEACGGNGDAAVTCWQCEIDGPSAATQQEAIERWNSRPKKYVSGEQVIRMDSQPIPGEHPDSAG